jgi:hypothetical protein
MLQSLLIVPEFQFTPARKKKPEFRNSSRAACHLGKITASLIFINIRVGPIDRNERPQYRHLPRQTQ